MGGSTAVCRHAEGCALTWCWGRVDTGQNGLKVGMKRGDSVGLGWVGSGRVGSSQTAVSRTGT